MHLFKDKWKDFVSLLRVSLLLPTLEESCFRTRSICINYNHSSVHLESSENFLTCFGINEAKLLFFFHRVRECKTQPRT